MAGARESRRIVGDYVLTGDVRSGQRHDDVVVLGVWRLDRHPATQPGYHDIPWTPPYDIPYRTLLPRNFENLLVAGRCHSATSEALASSRVTATAMGMGQAAGTAAAVALARQVTPCDSPVAQLQEQLLAAGAILEAPQSDIDPPSKVVAGAGDSHLTDKAAETMPSLVTRGREMPVG